jgi:hypothetical protein
VSIYLLDALHVLSHHDELLGAVAGQAAAKHLTHPLGGAGDEDGLARQQVVA